MLQNLKIDFLKNNDKENFLKAKSLMNEYGCFIAKKFFDLKEINSIESDVKKLIEYRCKKK